MSKEAQKVEDILTKVDEAKEQTTTPITETTETPEILTETENKGDSEQIEALPPVEPKNDEVVNNTKVDEVKKEVVKQATTKILKPKVPPPRTRFSLTGNFDAVENKNIREVIEARKKAGLTTTDDNFVRQCIDFAINHKEGFKDFLSQLEKKYQGGFFGVPDNYTSQPFNKKGFFNK